MASAHQNVTNFAQIALLCDAACRPAAFRVSTRPKTRVSCPKCRIWAEPAARSSAAGETSTTELRQPRSWCARRPRLPAWHGLLNLPEA